MRKDLALLTVAASLGVMLSVTGAQEEKKSTPAKETKPVAAKEANSNEKVKEKKPTATETTKAKETEPAKDKEAEKEKKSTSETKSTKSGSSTSSAKKATEVPELTADKPLNFWMAKKLDHSKSILESLTKGDFEQMDAVTEQMRLLGKIEGFVRRRNEGYRSQQVAFDSACQELIRQSKRGNAEGATLAFNQLTSSCTGCHILLREEDKQ